MAITRAELGCRRISEESVWKGRLVIFGDAEAGPVTCVGLMERYAGTD